MAIDLDIAEDRGHEFLAYYEAFSTEEIAEFFETTPGTVAAGILLAREDVGIRVPIDHGDAMKHAKGPNNDV